MLRDYYEQMLTAIGEDVNRPGLAETPERAAKAFEFLTEGYRQDIDEIVNEALFPSDNNEMVLVRDIEFYSLCEHHLLPFYGKAHVAYIPDGKILGLSKFARIVDVFARRLQVQEQLTKQIAECIDRITGATGTAVMIEARHMCMMMRGVEKYDPLTATIVTTGIFKQRTDLERRFYDMMMRQR